MNKLKTVFASIERRCSACSWMLPLFFCGMLAGCPKPEEIRQYRVVKEDAAASSPTAVPSGEQVWFFKLTTATSSFSQFSSDFARMIIGADLSAGVPKYDLPRGWKATAGPAPVFQTIQLSENDRDAILTITPLPAPADNPLNYLRDNVNRWRQQLGLKPVQSETWLEEAQRSSEIVSIPKGRRFITLVHLTGNTEKHGETEMLVALISDQSLTGSAAMAGEPPSSPVTGPSPLKFETPEGWKSSPGSAMRLASLAAEHESGSVDISVIQLPGGGDVLSNINRWRGQIDLEPVDAAGLEAIVEEVTIDAESGQLTLLDGPEQAILAAILDRDGVKWFFKMQGPKAAVAAENERFRQFLKSVTISDSED